MSKQEQEKRHQMRLSIDIRSIKDHEFTAQIYFKYASYPNLGIKHFRSGPTFPLTNAKVETNLKDCFNSYMFEGGRSDLQSKLNQNFKIQLWHSDRLKKDILLGVSTVNLSQLLELPLRKTNESYARVFDAYIPIDQIDESDKPIKKIATLRVIIYLEDLGPKDLLQDRGFDFKSMISEEEEVEHHAEDPHLPSEGKNHHLQQIQDEKLKIELTQLQYKVVWELETWKKAEEAKARIILKQKQIQFWTNLSEQQKKSDLEKEKQFKKMEANINLIENKVKAKMNELIKREQKIIILEQQLQNKIGQVSKQCFYKDEQIERVKRKTKEQKTAIIKQKSILQIEMAKLRAQNAKLRVQIEQLKKQDEKSPLNLLKNELNNKILEIKQMGKQLEKCNEIKLEYESFCDKLKNQLAKNRSNLSHKQDEVRQLRYQKELLKNNYDNLYNQLNYERQQAQERRNYNTRYQQDDQQQQEGQPKFESQVDRMRHLRKQLLDHGNYTTDDPAIKELDRKIASFS